MSQVPISEKDFQALCVQVGLDLDQQTLIEYFEIYQSRIQPMICRLRKDGRIETKIAVHHSEKHE